MIRTIMLFHTNKSKKLLLFVLALLVGLPNFVMFGGKTVNAASLVNVSDAMSRQKTGVSATHTFTFTLASTLGGTSRVKLTTASFSFGSLTPTFTGNNSCAGTAGVFGGSSPFVSSITSVTSCDSGDTVTFTVPASTNPAANTYVIVVETDANNDGTYEDSSNVAVDILSEDQVTVSASIGATFDFAVTAKTSGTVGSGGDTCESSGTTASSINFNNGVNLSTSTQYTHCHTLTVSTNATAGFRSFVAQSANLTNGTSDTISSFDDGTPPAVNSETTWSTPTSPGHFGFASSDTFAGSSFAAAGTFYGGFTGTTAYKIQDESAAVSAFASNVGYSVEILGTQEPGTYTNTLTYTSYGIF